MPSTVTTRPPPAEFRPTDDGIGRPTIVGADDGPEAPFPVRVQGAVERGFGRGSRELGCPTANLPAALTSHPALERNGVYYGWASLVVPSSHSSQPPIVKEMVMSVGYNPVYGNKSRTIEVHILHDFGRDFYGENVKLIITGFIRPEYNYTSKEELIKDIEIDKKAALDSLRRPAYQRISRDVFFFQDT